MRRPTCQFQLRLAPVQGPMNNFCRHFKTRRLDEVGHLILTLFVPILFAWHSRLQRKCLEPAAKWKCAITSTNISTTLTLPFCSCFKKFTLQSRVPSYMGLLEGIVVAALAIGLTTGSLLYNLCRPCGFSGEDDRKTSNASTKLAPVAVQKDSCDDQFSAQSIWLLLVDAIM